MRNYMEPQVTTPGPPAASAGKPVNQQSKQSKWRQLEKKYLQYIQHLKKKIEHVKKKNSAEQTKMTFVSGLSMRHNPRLPTQICLKAQACQWRCLYQGFTSIKLAAYDQQQKGMVRLSQTTEKQRLLSVKIRVVASSLERIRHNKISEAFERMLEVQDPNRQHSIGYCFRKLEQRIQQAKTDAFYSILSRPQNRIRPLQHVEASLKRVKTALNFEELIEASTMIEGDLLKVHYQNIQLKAANGYLTERVRRLEHDLAKEQEQRKQQTDKKEKGLIELGEEMAEKEALIEELEAQIQQLSKSIGPQLIKKLQSHFDNEELRSKVERLEAQVEDHRNSTKQSSIKVRQSESDLRQKISHLTNELEKATEGQQNLAYSKKLLEGERENLNSLKKIINKEEAQLRPRQDRCAMIETLFSRIHQQIAVQQMKATQILDQEQSAKQTLQRISSLINDKRLLLGNALETSHNSRTNLDILTMVEEMLERNKEFPYDQLINFGGICEDLFRIQQKIFKLRKANSAIREAVVTNGDGGGTRRRKWAPVDPSDWQASNIPESDPGINISGRHNHSNPQLTTRLIELQMEKKKCEDLVLQLKQKNMTVRRMVLELLRGLGLNAKSVSKETDYTLSVIIDMFEYSEQEKASMFESGKRRGFLGLF